MQGHRRNREGQARQGKGQRWEKVKENSEGIMEEPSIEGLGHVWEK